MAWGTQSSERIRRFCGSGFRNIFLCIFILFLLGGFLLEGNPPRRGLEAPPFHAGGAEPPAQRYSARLAQNNSVGSTLRRNTDPDSTLTYVPQWPAEVRPAGEPSVAFSMVDPSSPEPPSPEAEEVEAEVLDGSVHLLNVMRSFDGEGTVFADSPSVNRHGSVLPGEVSDSQATVDVEATLPHLEYSAPEVDKDSGTSHLPRGAAIPATPHTIDLDSEARDTLPSQNLLATEVLKLRQEPSRTKAKAKAKSKDVAPKLKWVPKVREQQGGASGGLAAAWAALDAITLQDEWKHSCATVREVPEFFSRQVQEAFHVATSRIREMHGKKKDLELERAWKLFLLLPRMLLSRTKHKGEEGKSEFFIGFTHFSEVIG